VPRLEAIVINCREPATLASFYAGLLGLAVSPGDAAAITAGTLGEDESVLLGSSGGIDAAPGGFTRIGAARARQAAARSRGTAFAG
jgi:hypothetical protein